MPRPALVRYVGLAGSLSLAVSAYRGGARSPWRPTMTPGAIFAGDYGVLLPSAWLLGTMLLAAAWWTGRRAVPSARWAYVTAGLWVVPLLPFLPLGSYDIYSYACQGWQQATGLDPYAGGVDLLGCPWRDAVAPTWHSSPAPYGPVFLLLAAVAAKVGGSLAGTVAALRVIALLGVALVAVWLPALARRGGVPPERAVWLVLACPLVPIHLVSGAHNDAVMVGLVVAGLVLAAGRRAWPAGILLALAVGVKATAVVVVPFAVLLVARESPAPLAGEPVAPAASAVGRRWRASGGFLGGFAGALAIVSLVSGRGFGWITGLAGSGVSVQWTSPPTAVGMTIGLFGPDAVRTTRIVGIVVLAVALVLLWWRALGGDVHRGAAWLAVPCVVGAVLCLPDGYNLALASKTQGAVVMTALVTLIAAKIAKDLHEAKNRNSRGARPDHVADRLSRPNA